MSSVENIQTNIEAAMHKIPGEAVTQAIASCETAGNILDTIVNPDGTIADTTIAVHAATDGLHEAGSMLEAGSTALGAYLNDIGAQAPDPNTILTATQPSHMRIGPHILFLPEAEPAIEVAGPDAPEAFAPDQHRQKEPEAWHDLLEKSGNLIADGLGPAQAAAVLYKAFARWGDQQIEDVRYYALGEHSALLAPRLRDPNIQQQVIDGAVQALAAHHPKHATDVRSHKVGWGLHVREINSTQLRKGVDAIVGDTFEQLPTEVQQLSDTINYYAAMRAASRQHGYPMATYPPISDELAGKGGAVHALAANVFSAASIMAQDALCLMAPPQALAEPVGTSGYDPKDLLLVRDVIDPSGLRTIDFSQPAHAGARLHFDEFTYGRYTEKHLSLRDGKPYLDVRSLPKEPGRVPVHTPDMFGRRALHDKRIGCPARFVQPLIPSVLQMMPDILIAADAEIRSL